MSSVLVKRTVPLVITFIAGVVIASNYYVNNTVLNSANTYLNSWATLVFNFVGVMASLKLLMRHAQHVIERRRYWVHSLLLVCVMAVFLSIGIIYGNLTGAYVSIQTYISSPIGATLTGLRIFAMVQAVYLTFKLKSFDSVIITVMGTIMILTNAGVVTTYIPFLASYCNWMLNVPILAVQRVIILTMGTAIVTQGVRIIMGSERAYLGMGVE